MQVKIFRSYDARALEEEMNDFLGNIYTTRILKIDYKVLLDHYDNLNERTHFLFSAIVHYIDDDEETEDPVLTAATKERKDRRDGVIYPQ